jgi:hypothetical protein
MGALDLFKGANAVIYGTFGVTATLHHIARADYDPRVGAPETVTDYSCTVVERPATYGRTEQGDEWLPFDEGIPEKRRWGLIDAQTLAVEPAIGDRLTAWGKTWNIIGVTRIGTENGTVSWGLNLEI